MNKASGGDGIPAELFQILKYDAVNVLRSICQQIWKTQQWPQDWKRSVFKPIPKKGNARECSPENCTTIQLCSFNMLVKLCSKSFKLASTVNRELLDVKAGFRKGRRTRDQIAKIFWITEKARRVQKNIYFFFDFMKAFDCMVQQTGGNYSRGGNTLPPYLSPEKPVCRTRSNSQNQT